MHPIVRLKTRQGEVIVLKGRSSVAYWQDERHQSHADLRGVSLVTYVHAIHDLIRQAGSRNVLMIGCGGGTLATMLHAEGVRVTIAEINELSFEISRRYFELPDKVECHVADGHAFLQRSNAKFDAIVLDAYDGEDIPQQLCSTRFFELVGSRLNADRGCFFANVILNGDRDCRLQRLLRVMRARWPLVRALDTPGTRNRNAIAMAGAVEHLQCPRLRKVPKVGRRSLERGLEALKFCDTSALAPNLNSIDEISQPVPASHSKRRQLSPASLPSSLAP